MRTKDEVIPRILSSTQKQKRPFSIVEIADDIEWLSKCLGGLSFVSDVVGISTGMLNKFLRVKFLTPDIQKLVEGRVIDSVALVNNLAKFSPEDQKDICQHILNGKMTNIDVGLLSPLRKQYPELKIEDLINKLKQSENKKVSVIQFSPEDLHRDSNDVKKALVKIMGDFNLLNFEINNHKGIMRMTPEGEKLLRDEAKRQKVSLQEFTYSLLK